LSLLDQAVRLPQEHLAVLLDEHRRSWLGGRVGLGEEPIEAAREVRGRSRGAGGDRGDEEEQRQDERRAATVPHG